MTGKELKAFAANVPDDAVISVRERGYGDWEERFQIQASLIIKTEEPIEGKDHV